ncbi:MAG: IPTL-CTERM sorting domain-containing protein [Pseudomonadota bacterium]
MASTVVVLFLALLPGITAAQSFGYAVNSDDEFDADQLLRVNLLTGAAEFLGPLPTSLEDVEGLAFGADGVLYAVDNATKAVFTVNTETVNARPVGNRSPNLGFSTASNLDFGMTFTCSNRLLLVAEETQSLYEIDVATGQAMVVGESGGLGAPMTAIASYGSQTVALASGGGLYNVDIEAGSSSLIGQIQGFDISDAGLAFDGDGTLWAVLDGTRPDTFEFLPGKILRINLETAEATEISETRPGIESLAVAPPNGCIAGTPTEAVPTLSEWGLILLVLAVILIAARSRQRLV